MTMSVGRAGRTALRDPVVQASRHPVTRPTRRLGILGAQDARQRAATSAGVSVGSSHPRRRPRRPPGPRHGAAGSSPSAAMAASHAGQKQSDRRNRCDRSRERPGLFVVRQMLDAQVAARLELEGGDLVPVSDVGDQGAGIRAYLRLGRAERVL